MALALLDSFTARARERRAEYERTLDESRKSLERRQTELAETEKQRKEIEPRYKQFKQNVHPHLHDNKAEELAKETIVQMDKQGNTLNIELAGIRAKLKVIDEYLEVHSGANPNIERLEALRIDQLIELSSLEARREAIERIVALEQEFCRLFAERIEVGATISSLRRAIGKDKERIAEMTNRLANADEGMKPPQVFENKIVIYPIVAEDPDRAEGPY
jgi:chromosome segregation ATPase